MRAYFFKVLFSALGIFILYFLISVFWQCPIVAEYWVPEMVVVKKNLAEKIKSPKIIFIGGSNVLYNIDASRVEKELHIPCFNFGLHAGMPLKWLLEFTIDSIKPGDIVILALEQPYYQSGLKWGEWRYRNAVAWKHESLDRLKFMDKLHALVDGGTFDIFLEIINTKWALFSSKDPSEEIKKRLIAFEKPEIIIKKSDEAERRGLSFPFWQPIDRHGTVIQSNESSYRGAFVNVTTPNSLDPEVKKLLADFLLTMKHRGVRVYFANSPYGVDHPPEVDWSQSEGQFKTEISHLGSEVIERRSDLFFPRKMFFNTRLHMTQDGKEARTRVIIEALKQKGVGIPSSQVTQQR